MVNRCEICETDIGNSLWGWCSVECLHQISGSPVLFSGLEMKMLLKFIGQSGWSTGIQRIEGISDMEYEAFLKKLDKP